MIPYISQSFKIYSTLPKCVLRVRCPSPLHLMLCMNALAPGLPTISPKLQCANILIHLNSLLLQLHFRLINLLHEFLVCVGYIVEGKNTVAKFEEQECAERDQCPER